MSNCPNGCKEKGQTYCKVGNSYRGHREHRGKQEGISHREEKPADQLLFIGGNGEGGIRTRGTGVYPYDGLANRCLKPLGHLSKIFT